MIPKLRGRLLDGLVEPSQTDQSITYRFLRPADDISAITELLHRAYAPLAAQNLHFVASHQSPEVTRQRASKGHTLVALLDGCIVGTITLADAALTRGCPFYDRPDVASFGQFGVEPAIQRLGIGTRLLSLAEALAMELGVHELALDTAETAVDLIRFYSAKGYRFVEFHTWAEVNYRSVVMAKRLHSR
jgi:GNAT superfamily N-acetyltransferase